MTGRGSYNLRSASDGPVGEGGFPWEKVSVCEECGGVSLTGRMTDCGGRSVCCQCNQRQVWARQIRQELAKGSEERAELKRQVVLLENSNADLNRRYEEAVGMLKGCEVKTKEMDDTHEKVKELNEGLVQRRMVMDEEIRVLGAQLAQCRKKGGELEEQKRRVEEVKEDIQRREAEEDMRRREILEKIQKLEEGGGMEGVEHERIEALEKKVDDIDRNKSSKNPRVLLIGDGNIGRMRRRINEMIAGDRRMEVWSSELKKLEEFVEDIEGWVNRGKGEKMVILHAGVNDLLDVKEGEEAEMKDKMCGTIKRLVEMCENAGVELAVCSVPPVRARNGKDYRSLAQEVNVMWSDIAVGRKVEFLNIRYVADEERNMHVDGVHYGIRGQRLASRPIVRRIASFLGVPVKMDVDSRRDGPALPWMKGPEERGVPDLATRGPAVDPWGRPAHQPGAGIIHPVQQALAVLSQWVTQAVDLR